MMVRASMPSVRSVMLFMGVLALLVATIVLPGGASAQIADRVVVPVTGKLSDGGTFKGRVNNPEIEYVPGKG